MEQEFQVDINKVISRANKYLEDNFVPQYCVDVAYINEDKDDNVFADIYYKDEWDCTHRMIMPLPRTQTYEAPITLVF